MMLLHNDWPLPVRKKTMLPGRASRRWWRASAASALLALALVCGLLIGCTASRESVSTGALQLTLVHSNDTMGKLEPCG